MATGNIFEAQRRAAAPDRAPARFGAPYQIPRNSLALLMLAQLAVLLPLTPYVSPWIIGVALFCGFWRWQIYRGRWSYPARWVKGALVLLSASAVALSQASAFSVETATMLCCAAFALKLIEMKTQRDAYLVIFLAYFLIAVAFLFAQSLGQAAYQLLASILVTGAMVAMNQRHNQVRPIASLKVAASLLLQALPIMIVVFLFFPRLAPLWSVPLPGSAQTGISDSVTPGEIARLSQSDEIAFRVEFADRVPGNRSLYFRGVVFSHYDEGTWRQLAALPADFNYPSTTDESAIDYSVLLESTQRNWLFALDLASPLSGPTTITQDFRLQSSEPVTSLLRYDVRSFTAARLPAPVQSQMLRRDLQLPADQEMRTRAFARQLYAQLGEDPDAYLDYLLRYIREQPYGYTLNPPAAGTRDSVDRFWFDTRRGFCTHYAGALVVLLRAVDIPARMVGGYQGGEVNPVTGHLVVRSRDAHAWVEALLPERGWLRIDPTAAVAPNRIEQGLEAALSDADRAARAGFANGLLDGMPLLSNLAYWAESIDHRWNMWVVGFDGAQQQKTLSSWLGDVSPTRLGLALVIGVALVMAAVAGVLFWRERAAPTSEAVRVLLGFERTATRFGMPRAVSETPSDYLKRVAEACGLGSEEGAGLARRMSSALYDPGSDEAENPSDSLRALRRDLLRLRWRLAFG
ncbi:MAG: DUF3488 and transglutaminase-like domain-containing protein [Pseudomonadaceae bacterium]|nr:DUF3488 and transglutaminase-like domain-containing protein [Pseudomonadaceae bacterium]